MGYEAHPAQVELAKVFSSVRLVGPPLSDQLLELVAHLFSPEEAEVAVHLPIYYPRPLAAIAKKARRNAAIILPLLDRMAERKVIVGKGDRFSILPLLPGMFEYMLCDGRDSDWHRKYNELLMAVWGSGYVKKYNRRHLAAVRNVPVQTAIAGHESVLADADRISAMIDAHQSLGVLNVCQCRQSLRWQGHECKRAAVEDGCLGFGSFVEGVERTGIGRLVSKQQMREVVAERYEKKLVLMTANVEPESPNVICTCCDCCCHFLESVHHWDGIVSVAAPHFLAVVDTSRCKHCGKCVRACNPHAHTIVAKRHQYDPSLCLGCGLCVGVCKEEAITLAPNPNYEPPAKGFPTLGLKLLPGVAAAMIGYKLAK
jgi:NAD-dependent dihydropyrimidine dehydrogenase PreA subunit